MRLRPSQRLLLLPALTVSAGLGLAAPAKKTAEKKPPSPSAPAKPAPTKPAPAKPAPAKPAPAPSSEAETLDPNRAKALVRAITAQEKSEKAGEVFKKFIDGTAEERSKLVADQAKYGAEAAKYFSESPNRDFKPLSLQILGTVTSPTAPDRVFFAYFLATDKNPLGFVTMVVETADGFRVDWNSFVRGHDQDLEKFLEARAPGSTLTSLVGITKTHIFGDGPPGGDDKNFAFAIDMPPPRSDRDPAKVYVEKNSETGKVIGGKLGWTRGHLCWLTMMFEGEPTPLLKIKAYQPYAK